MHSSTRPPRARLTVSTIVAVLVSVTCRDATGPGDGNRVSLRLSRDSVSLLAADSIAAAPLLSDADGGPLARAVTWSSRDEAVARVSAAGVIHGLSAGRTFVVARSGTASDSLLVVVPRAGRITLSPDAVAFDHLGERATVAAALESGGAVRYFWSSRDSGVVSVSQSGELTARGDGRTFVTVREDGGAADSLPVEVRQLAVRVVVTASVLTRPVGRTVAFHAAALDRGDAPVAGAVLTWSVTDSSVAAVSAAGVVTALREGVDTVRATVAGVSGASGAAPLVVGPPQALHFLPDTIVVGVGQTPSGFSRPQPRVGVTDSLEAPFTVALAAADPAVVSVPAALPVPDGLSPAASKVVLVGLRAGSTAVTATAPGFQPATGIVRVTTPHLTAVEYVGASSRASVGQPLYFGVAIGDSLGATHHAAAALTISARSSDTSVLALDATSFPVAVLDVGANVTVRPVGRGRATVYFSAPGYVGDSITRDVIAPKLRFVSWDFSAAHERTVGLGQQLGLGAGRIVADGGTTPPSLAITQRHPELSRVELNPPYYGAPSGSFDVYGLALGEDTVIATAAGYDPDTFYVHVTRPFLQLDEPPASLRAFGAAAVSVFAGDSAGRRGYPVDSVLVRATSSDPSVLRVGDSAWIGNTTAGSGAMGVWAVGPGTAHVTYRDAAGAYVPYVTKTITVAPAALAIGVVGRGPVRSLTLGARQRFGAGTLYATTPYTWRTFTTWLHLSSLDPAVAVPDRDSVMLPLGEEAATFDVLASGNLGTARIVASTAATPPETLAVVVGRPTFGLVAPAAGYVGQQTATARVQLFDQSGQPRQAATDARISLSSSRPDVMTPAAALLSIGAGRSVSDPVALRFTDAGSTVLRAEDADDGASAYGAAAAAIAVGYPALALHVAPELGVGQGLAAYVGRPNDLADRPLVVAVRHSGTALTTPATTITVPAGYSSFPIDLVGARAGVDTITVAATGYAPPPPRPVRVARGHLALYSGASTIRVGDSTAVALVVYAPDGSSAGAVAAATTFALDVTGGVIVSDGSRAISRIEVPAGASRSAAFFLKGLRAGTASVRVSQADYDPVTLSLTVASP